MRKILSAAILVVLAAAGTWWFVAPGDATPSDLPKWSPADPPRPAPALAFSDLEGRPVALADFRGRVVLLNLWATWCLPCVEEMPALDRLQARLGGADFEVVALSLDRGGRGQVEPFLGRLGLANLRGYLDQGSAAMRALAVRGLPTTFLIDRQGRILGQVEGAAPWDSPAAVRLIEHVLERRGEVVRTGG